MRGTLFALFLLLAPFAFAQEVVHRDDFQSYKTPSNPPGWVDTSVGKPRPQAEGLFKAWPDPLQGNQGTNVVYGTKQSSGKPEGNNPRIGTFSTLTTKEFSASGRFEYRGRLIRTNADSRIGLTFLSAYPQQDQYYLIGLWGSHLSMQLFAFGAGTLQGTLDSNLTIDPNRWYRFLIQVDDNAGVTHIRARFWPDGTTEPATFTIEASDGTPQRLKSGRIGMWAAVKGEAYIDDLDAKSPIDLEPPHLTFTSHAEGAVITTPSVIVTGNADDAVRVAVNNIPATLEAGTFRSGVLALTEGVNTITAIGPDPVGNVGVAVLHLELDTRAPEVTITAPAVGACLDAATVTVSGTVRDPRLESVKVNDVSATIANGTWTASLALAEGEHLLTIVATDTLGHVATIARSIRIDRTAPAIDVRESGTPFTATLLSRSVSFLVRAEDADPRASVIARLDGAEYVSGTLVTAEGAHQLEVTATDCAGHTSSRTFAFTIDRTPPAIRDLDPANGSTLGHKPNAIHGAVDADTAMIQVVARNLAVAPAPNATFTIDNVPFAEGVNRFVLEATDKAGNRAELDYVVTVKTSAPVVSILENGSPLVAGTLYSRAVTPVVEATDDATITVTLNGASFTSGTTIAADGTYRLIANATDSLGHTGTAETTFTIDRTAPVVHITAPAAGSVDADRIEVRGTATNAVAADVNGIPVTLGPEGAFVLPSLPIELGTTLIVATARDRAGNIGRDEIEVTRDDIRPGILITYPYDRALTNRPVTEVLGRVLSPPPDGVVTIGTSTTPVDPLGAFRFSGYPLVEGDNTITASTRTNNGATSSTSVIVTADFTPPALTILESAQPLTDGARFAEQAVLSVETEGNAAAELTIDGTKIATLPHAVIANGGHSAVAIARDPAGNETRVERTFFIGTSGGGATTCTVDGFDPANDAIVLSATTTLVGRVSGASSVSVNDAPATVADGSFRATVELPNEGPNTITVRCAESVVTLTLNRVTGDPSIAIVTPAEGSVTADETIAVTGTIGEGVVSADVNSAPATITANTFTVPAVRLASGLNVLVAHGRNAAGRVATASRRVFALRSLPSISISSPLGQTATGATKIEVAGTFANLDPSTLIVTNLSTGATVAVQANRASDTTGSFTAADVPLVAGEQTLRVSGRDEANREATATVVVELVAGAPSIEITSPIDHAYFGPEAGTTFTVSGTFSAAEGSTVEVAGTAATLNGSTFTATVPFATIGSVTAIVARVNEPDGASAIDSVVVTKLAAAPKVIESFPAPNAVEVDAGALLLVLFSAPMDRASLANGAFRLEDANGSLVSGTLFLDKDVLTFAPSALLTRGARYTLRVTSAAKDLAGTSLTTEWLAPFTIGTSAPSTPPDVTPVTSAFCGQTVAIDGTAPAGARLQLESGELTLSTLADAQGRFHFDFPLSGQSGFAVVRVRIAGSDGSLSPAAELTFRVDCVGPQVLNATYDRSGANRLTIVFSEPIDATTTGAISIGGNVTVTDNTVVVVPTENLTAKSFTLTITTALRDTTGNALAAPYAQAFNLDTEQPPAGDGSGFISGEVYDATTGRPLAGATITIDAVQTTTDVRGRYLIRLPEGAHTIRATHTGYTTVWRQIIVPAGAGVIPIDIRLEKLTAPITFVGAQSIAGLLPLGWSPLSSLIASEANDPLVFTVPTADIVAASQNLTAVRYDEVRDEWTVIAAVVNMVDGKVTIPITSTGAYALVYPDKAPGLASPPLASTGAALVGVAAPTETAPLVARSFALDPPIVLPDGRALATLTIEGAGSATFPSGTAVQAYIDEELRLADGSRLLDPPFATDLLLYRNLSGTLGIADFHLAPSPRAAQVILEIGFDHIRVVPYPGRLDRGTLIGAEGGRVPADDKVAIDIPAGATPEPLRATATSMTQQDLDAIGSIAGFRIAGGFTLTLQRATPMPPQDLDGDGVADVDAPAVELFKSARATFTISDPGTQFILAEVLDRMPRLAAQMTRIDGARVTTNLIDRSILPVDGIIREGRFLILAAESPIAFATGTLRFGNALLSDARITANSLGVPDLTRAGGIFNVPVLAKPAAPFTLIPNHATTGDGAPYTHSVAPDPDAVVEIDLTLTLQPPTINAVTVFAGQPPTQVALDSGTTTENVSLTTSIRASFSPAIDPSSVTADSIVVRDFVSGEIVGGTATAEGTVAINWTITPGARLQSDRRYRIVLSPNIRAASGAALGNVAPYAFHTLKTIANAEVRAERISITIPNEQGVSRITGEPGALPAGWQALVVRRDNDFITRYQSTAASDGSFTFLAGNGGDASDRITIADLIDLQVINNAGNLAAIFPLTPFVTEDRRGFVVSAATATKFTSADGISVDIPAGTFDEPALVEVKPSTKEALNDIPTFDQELNYAASVRLDFEGKAKQPIELELPVPAGMDTANRDFILALRGESTRGPRLMAVDTLRVENGKFTTRRDPNGASRRVAVQRIGTHETIPSDELKDHLLRVKQSGEYIVIDIKKPADAGVGWAAVSGVELNYELHWDSIGSLYASLEYIIERGGVIVIPVLTGKPFTVVGIDAATGIEGFSKLYDPIPIGNPGISIIPPPKDNRVGPFPVFGTPFRVETIELSAEDVPLETIPNFVIELSNGQATIEPSEDDPLPPEMHVEVLNTTNGEHAANGPTQQTMTVAAKTGDLLVLLVEEKEADASGAISVVFNEPIFVDGENDDEIDTFLRDLFTLEKAMPVDDPETTPLQFADVNTGVRYSVDSGNRRVTASLPATLQRDAIYRLKLSKDISDPGSEPGDDGQRRNQLKLGQGTKLQDGQYVATPSQNRDLHLLFRVRKPAGTIGTFEIPSGGAVRDVALHGNVLFVAAGNGGLLAYDVADPALLNASDGGEQPLPFARAIAYGDLRNVTTDHHDRIYVIGMGSSAGSLSSYRLEDFLAVRTQDPAPFCCLTKGSTLINWRMGYSAPVSIGTNILLSDRPESIPRKLQILVQDEEEKYENREDFKKRVPAEENDEYPNGIVSLAAEFEVKAENPYRVQRITVVNDTLDLRWSADATPTQKASIEGILAGPNDRLRVIRNRATYGVVSHLGFGIGVYDLNAMESNSGPNRPAIPMAEQIALTRGAIEDRCFQPYTSEERPSSAAIPEIWLSSDNAVRTGEETPDIFVYAPDPYRGLLDLRFKTPGNGTQSICDQRGKNGLVLRGVRPEDDHRRIAALKAAYQAAAERPAYPQFTSVASYRWHLDAEDNEAGIRKSVPKEPVTRDYVLLAGGDLGLLVVEVGGDVPDAPNMPASHWPLDPRHLVDVIWIPDGAIAVRTVPKTNYAVVVGKYGRVHLVDLTRIDERWDDAGDPIAETALFSTALAAIQGLRAYPDGVGAADPRIMWTSEPDVALGGIPPVLDPDTGMLYAGHVTKKVMKVVAALDPRIRLEVDLGEEDGPTSVSSIVPHGIALPKNVQDRIDALPACSTQPQPPHCKENAALGTFRLEISLPGALVDALQETDHELRFAVESERVFNAPTEQTPPGFPRSHLRRALRDGTAEKESRVAEHFRFRRVVPEDPELAKALRHQKGFNKFVSPWIVAIADPRASSQYLWAGGATPQQKADAGCESCNRPMRLNDAGETEGVYELWTNGRLIAIRPEVLSNGNTLFDETRYSYLGEANRLVARFATIMADTVRTQQVRVAGQNPPVADGAIQDTVYLHSGEMQTAAVDLVAGGRAGVDVLFDRTYRSRTLGPSILGQGWESSNVQRLRALPNGNVEYRDATGEIWLYELDASKGTYKNPPGLFLRLTHDQRGGWRLIDQQWRVTGFDDLGRLLYEADEFAGEVPTTKGNVLHYIYDHTGRLSQIVDPVGRATELRYWAGDEASEEGAYPGLLKEIEDWRERTVAFEYDEYSRLTTVKAPEFAADPELPQEFDFTGENRPRTEYTYAPVTLPPDEPQASQQFNDYIELAFNLEEIKEPDQVAAATGKPRVKLTYDESTDHPRDRVTKQEWAEQETVEFTHTSPTEVTSVDALGQQRDYTLTRVTEHDERVHVATATVKGVWILEGPEPPRDDNARPPTAPSVAMQPAQEDLTTTYTYNREGLHATVVHPTGLTITNEWAYAADEPGNQAHDNRTANSIVAGMVLDFVRWTGIGLLTPLDLYLKYDQLANNRMATVIGAGRDVENKPDPQFREAPPPSRELRIVETPEEGAEVESKDYVETEYDEAGLPLFIRKRDAAHRVKRESWTNYYENDEEEPIKRARPSVTGTGDAGNTETEQEIDYSTLAYGGEQIDVEDKKRKTKTETKLDAYGRTTRLTTTDENDEKLAEELYGYDAAGRLVYHSREQEGVGTVITRVKYDALGRELETSIDKAEVMGATTTVTSKKAYDLLTGEITEYDPAGPEPAARTVTFLDDLGRPTITKRYGIHGETLSTSAYYNRAGLPSYQTDHNRSASLTSYDAAGRERITVRSDGVWTDTRYDSWGQPFETLTKNKNNELIAHTKRWFTRNGQPVGTVELITEGSAGRSTYTKWENGRTEHNLYVSRAPHINALIPTLTTDVRLHQQFYDSTGRLEREASGASQGTAADLTDAQTFSAAKYVYDGGNMPQSVIRREPRVQGAQSTTTTIYDGLDRPRHVSTFGASPTVIDYDEAGNVLSMKPQGMAPTTSKYDSRGLVIEATHPGGLGAIQYQYDALGNMRVYTDEEGKHTLYVTDGMGRVREIQYPDQTREETDYEAGTGLVTATLNRNGEWLAYKYGFENRLESVHAGRTRDAPKIVEYAYDASSRLIAVRNDHAAIEYKDFDLLGRPAKTHTVRYKDGSGLSQRTILDVHTQTHVWNVYDERDSWTMPATGLEAPAVETPPWIQTVDEARDGGSNLTLQQSPDGRLYTRSVGRGVGRISDRRRGAGTATLDTIYGYEDGTSIPPAVALALPETDGPPYSFLMRYALSSYGTTPVGGTGIGRDTADRIKETRDYGLGNRMSRWLYDPRGRLQQSWIDIFGPTAARPPTVRDDLTLADFRQGRTITPAGDPSQRPEGAPASWMATDNDAHQLETRSTGQTYQFEGGRRVSDGQWASTFDRFGRLISIANADRKIDYTWDPNDRIVGRAAYKAVNGAWAIEDRPSTLDGDGLPARTTFVWDPIQDRLVSIFEEGGGALLRQYLHGDQGYDDPVRVLVGDGHGNVRAYLPIFDEAGTGSLQAVVDADSGEIVERVLYADSYGDAPRYLNGAIVDDLTFEAKKSAEGRIENVTIRVHLSEAVQTGSLEFGVRLSATTPKGTIESGATPTLPDSYTIQWNIDGDSWKTLWDFLIDHKPNEQGIFEIAVTNELRTERWGVNPIMGVPAWAKDLYPVHSSDAIPLAIHQTDSQLAGFFTNIPANQSLSQTFYAMPDLYLAAGEMSRTNLLTGFKAAPFIEPATSLAYFRARWYDPGTGTWLTPDPQQYTDSSNLYAGFGNDPVNHSDPTGTVIGIDNLIGGAISVGVGWAMNCAFGKCDYSLADAAIDFGVGFATSGLSSIAHLRHLREGGKQAARYLGRAALEIGADVGGEAAKSTIRGESITGGQLLAEGLLSFGLGELAEGAVAAYRNFRAGNELIQVFHGTSSVLTDEIDRVGLRTKFSTGYGDDFGFGAYFGPMDAAIAAAHKAVRQNGGTPVVGSAFIRRRDLGRLLDLRPGTKWGDKWNEYLDDPTYGVRTLYLYNDGIKSQRGDLFYEFVSHNPNIGKFDSVIGPGYPTFGGEWQLAVKSILVARRFSFEWMPLSYKAP